jgi:2-polyprenyl-3-methyl-5-hydroxy-6-metoxy-1,4-benzoquinol methylase
MNSSGWDNFWKDQRKSFDTVMKIGTTFFGHQLVKLLEVKTGDTILDYGCGPGFLADSLASRKLSFTGADINSYYLEQCRKNHPSSSFIEITPYPNVNEGILREELKGEKFKFVVLLSISQYFKNFEELESVIQMLGKFTDDQGKIVLADVVDPNSSGIRDAIALLYHCVLEGKVKSFFTFIFYLLSSNYRNLSRNIKLLEISKDTIDQIAHSNRLTVQKMEGLTIHSSRTNYVFTKIE